MKLHNTLSRKVEEFKPISGSDVSLYTCGLTVYSQPHIGNWVAYIYWDILVRTLQANGYDVNHVQNITDVGHLTSDEDAGEDKMLASALKEGTTAWDVADKYIKIADHEAYELLGLLRPDHMPRATDYIPQQIAFVQELEKKGYTYVIKDGMYFDTSKLKNYGELARLDIKGLQFGKRVADTGKKNPTDFAVWKFSNPDEKRDMEWGSPWGKGFPGWHLECSTMAREILGNQIDIHAGGVDHIPVHHTNEIAQTEAVTGKKFTNYWVHANHMKVNGTKMSKSLGNIYTLKDIKDKNIDLQAFKLLVLSKHYRTEGNFTWDILDASAARLKRWQNMSVLRHQPSAPGDEDSAEGVIRAIADAKQALNDDLNTPLALEHIETAFGYVENGIPDGSESAFAKLLDFIDDSLGLHLKNQPDIEQATKKLLAERAEARDAKDFKRSDEIRDQLTKQNIEVRDTPHGQLWGRL